MSSRRTVIAASAWVFLAANAACLDHELPEDNDPSATFIALQRDFAPFESWPSYELGASAIEGHPVGDRKVFIDSMPPSGSTEFPNGTMIVKTVAEGPIEDWIIHAMVKRGGGYNLRGAKQWEWFELKFDRARTPVLVWRGQEPPNGERYGCLSGTCEDAPDCNQCHGDAIANDFVFTSELKLSEL